MFSAWAAQRWPQARIVAFEPIASNLAIFRGWLAASGAPVELVAKAAGVAPGSVSLMDRGAGSRVVPGPGPRGSAEVADLFGWLTNADLAKIDIEGAEWELLADPRLAECKATIVMEYHPIGAPRLPARQAAASLLQQAGYQTGYGSENYWGHGTIWAWRD
jgi:FkbM family methyltransferase